VSGAARLGLGFESQSHHSSRCSQHTFSSCIAEYILVVPCLWSVKRTRAYIHLTSAYVRPHILLTDTCLSDVKFTVSTTHAFTFNSSQTSPLGVHSLASQRDHQLEGL
jgi:hypothetical protein